ncbi:MAG: glycosyltransferase [Chitinophagales bacterium]|jgi:glycosyltransferase involved in cell wall biosynthesis|nr:glycosyltransferase [Chitinophagales bacterium]
MPKNILYLSHDGMTDALGQSQVLTYLIRLAQKGHQIHLISAEKGHRLDKFSSKIQTLCDQAKIHWYPLKYHNSIPILHTFWDMYQMKSLASRIIEQYQIQIIHARGYITSIVAQQLKKSYGVKHIFDIRGFWPDEKRDAGDWSRDKWLMSQVYDYFKRKEIDLFGHADYVVSLTEAGKNHIVSHFCKSKALVGVIPTCVNHDLFVVKSQVENLAFRQRIGISESTKIFLYSGALGTDKYDINILKQAFSSYREIYSDSLLLILSKDDLNFIFDSSWQVKVQYSPFEQVRDYINISDLAFVFYGSGWSNIGRSPTKLGEYLACGTPAVTYGSMGDVATLASSMAIYPIESLKEDDFRKIIAQIEGKNLSREEIAAQSREYYGLERGIDFYDEIYGNI